MWRRRASGSITMANTNRHYAVVPQTEVGLRSSGRNDSATGDFGQGLEASFALKIPITKGPSISPGEKALRGAGFEAQNSTGRERKDSFVKILVVEDESKTAAYVRKGLTESGFVVDVAEDGTAGLDFARASDYDLIVLDIMLPGKDGWSVLAELRRSGKETPVLFLTARDAVEDRVRGLHEGADDYLVKPFAFAELLERVRTLLRRSPVRQPETLRIGDLEIDSSRHRATRAGKRLDLTPKEFALLSLLARRKGEVLTRTLIAGQVWDMNFDSHTNVVEVHMRRLRAKVDDPFERKLIRTVRGVGYVLEEGQ